MFMTICLYLDGWEKKLHGRMPGKNGFSASTTADDNDNRRPFIVKSNTAVYFINREIDSLHGTNGSKKSGTDRFVSPLKSY